MPYTLWSRDMLVGETDFSLGEQTDGHRVGVFHPAPAGMMLLPAITAMAPALFDLQRAVERGDISSDLIEEAADGEDAYEALMRTPEGRRVMASAQHMVSLELRDPRGRPLLLKSILVSDLEEIRRFEGSETGAELAPETPVPPPSREPIRYIISVTLAKRKPRHDGD